MTFPKIEEFHFRFLFGLQIDHVLIFWNAPLFYVRIFWNAPFFPFSESDRKNGAFQKIRTWKSGAFQKISTWSILKLKMNRKWNSSILGHFKKLRKCHHMTKSSFTCFLGHSMIPRVEYHRKIIFKWTRSLNRVKSHIDIQHCSLDRQVFQINKVKIVPTWNNLQ